MNKNLIKSAFVAAIVAVSGINVYNSQKSEIKLSDVAMANVEALADNEELKPGNYNVYDEVTTYSVDGIANKKTKIRHCEDGGNYECKEGNYYCFLMENGFWSEWIPA